MSEEDGEDYGKYMARGGTIVLISMLGAGVSAFLVRLVLTRTVSPEEYGLLFAIIAFFQLFSYIKNLGLKSALGKFIPQYRVENDYDKIRSSVLTSLFIVTLVVIAFIAIVWVFSPWLAESYFEHDLARPLIFVMSGWFFLMAAGKMVRYILKGFKNMVGYSIFEFVRQFSTIIFILIGVLFFGFGIVGISVGYIFGVGVAFLLILFILRRKHPKLWEGTWSLDFSLGKKLLIFGLPLVLSGVAGAVMKRFDTLMIAGFWSTTEVGLYEVAVPTVRMLRYFGTALGTPLLPMISEMWAEGKMERIRSSLRVLAKYSVVLVVLPAVILLAFPEEVIRVLFTHEYVGAATALQILTVGIVFHVGSRVLSPVLVGAGYNKKVLISKVVPTVFNVGANLVLIPFYGIEGAAIATAASFFLILIIQYYYVRDKIGLPVPVGSILKALIGGGISLGVIWILTYIFPPFSLGEVLLIAVLVSVFYVVWILRTGAIDEDDLGLVERSLPVPEIFSKIIRKLMR